MKTLIFSLFLCCAAGLFAAEKDFDVYLLIGQSNMAGRGEFLEPDTTTAIEGVWLLDSIGKPVEAVPPINRYSSIRKDIKLQGYAPGNEFSRLVHLRTGRPVLIVANAKGGSAISQWMPGDRHGFLNEAIRRTRQAMEHGKLRGILWHQGETDVQKRTKDYAGKFNIMINALRDSLASPDVPVVVGQLGEWGWAPKEDIRAFNDSVIPAICRKVKNCRYASSYRLHRRYRDNERDPHFGREAQRELGRRYADAMLPQTEKAYITKYKGNRRSAISFTFDDGDLDHYLLVAPELEKRGLRGTFWIVGNTTDKGDAKRPRATWRQLREMSDRGHEISNHSFTHGKLVKMAPEEAARDIAMNDSAIERNVGKRPVTFCYPFNATTTWLREIASKGRVGTRLHQKGIGQQNNKSTAGSIKEWVDDVVDNGDWGVTMTHGITVGYDMWDNPQLLWDMMDYVKGRDAEIWAATFREVAAYEAERDNTVVRVKERKNGLELSLECGLDPDLFDIPLTIAVKGDWNRGVPTVRSGKEKLPCRLDGGLLLIEALPEQSSIQIDY